MEKYLNEFNLNEKGKVKKLKQREKLKEDYLIWVLHLILKSF